MTLVIDIGEMREDEATPLYEMVERVTQRMVCADFEPEGHKEFFDAVSLMLFERPENHQILVARLGARPVGLMDVRDNYHICLFFVDLDVQGKGVGRALFEAAVRRCRGGDRPSLEVHSSLFAVPVYKAFGFETRSGVRLVNGIRFVEMVRPTPE